MPCCLVRLIKFPILLQRQSILYLEKNIRVYGANLSAASDCNGIVFIFWNSQVPLVKFTVTSSLYEDMLETSLNSLQIHTNNSAMEHAWINIPTEQFKHRLHATLCHYHYSDKRKSYVLLSSCLIFWHFSFK